MAWIALQDTVLTHHKTFALGAALGISEAEAVGHLVALWLFAMMHRPKDGDLGDWGDAGMERAARWTGEAGAFVAALRNAGLMDGTCVHGWEKHTLHYAFTLERAERKRQQTAERVRRYRERQRGDGNAGNAPVTKSNAATRQDKTRQDHKTEVAAPAGKKRSKEATEGHAGGPEQGLGGAGSRGEGKGSLEAAGGPGGQPAPLEPRAQAAFEALVAFKLADLGRDACRLAATLAGAYPNVDLAAEIRKAEAWGVTNRVTRSAKGWARTLNSWMGREQDKARAGRGAAAPEFTRPQPGKYGHLGKQP